MTLTGVVGAPVAHSKSPIIHRYWLQKAGLSGVYAPIHVDPADFALRLDAMRRAGFAGVNVTLPHKEQAYALVDEATARARTAGSVNTLTFASDGRLHGDSTDGYGFIESLVEGAPQLKLKGSVAALLGAGGAVRSVAMALVEAGVGEIRICNRTRARAEAIQSQAPKIIRVFDWPVSRDFWRGAALWVNGAAFGVAKGGAAWDLNLVAALALPEAEGVVAVDLVYTPLLTPFLRHAERAGAHTVDGLGMLLHQARSGFHRWNGVNPVVDAALRAHVASHIAL